MPLDVIKKLIKHPLTDSGLAKFLSDWDELQGADEPASRRANGVRGRSSRARPASSLPTGPRRGGARRKPHRQAQNRGDGEHG